MDNSLVVPLTVSGVGMLTLFIALAILYGLIYLMTAVTRDRHQVEPQAHAEADMRSPKEGLRSRRRAAAIAVALARAECARVVPSLSRQGVTTSLSRDGVTRGRELRGPWWTLHHQRRLTLRPRARRPR